MLRNSYIYDRNEDNSDIQYGTAGSLNSIHSELSSTLKHNWEHEGKVGYFDYDNLVYSTNRIYCSNNREMIHYISINTAYLMSPQCVCVW